MKKPLIIIPLILALLAVCGAIVAVLWFTLGIGINNIDFFRLPSVSATADETKQYTVNGPANLIVESNAGDIHVTGGDGKEIVVAMHKTAWGLTEKSAQDALRQIKVEIKQDGNTLTVKFKQDERLRLEDHPNSVDFTINVPRETAVQATTSFGQVSLSDTKGAADISSSFGDIGITKLDGGLQVRTSSGSIDVDTVNAGGDPLSLQSDFGQIRLKGAAAGVVTVTSRSGALNLENVSAAGAIVLNSDFGEIKFNQGSGASLQVKANSGEIQLNSLDFEGPASVTSDFGEIVLDQVQASAYDIQAGSGAITVIGAGGSLKAHSNFGDVNVRDAKNATLDLETNSGAIHFTGSLGAGPHTVHSDFGEIQLTIPENTALNVDLKTNFGKIKSDLTLSMTVNGNLNANHIIGTINGGGSSLTASTDSGDIRIDILK
jgi:DUF4097 and DUF4098 domain-containing protein YvlB